MARVSTKKTSQTAKKKKPTRKVSLSQGGTPQSKSRVNQAGNYTKPTMRKNLFNQIKSGTAGGGAGQWSARKAQMLAKQYKTKGGGYK